MCKRRMGIAAVAAAIVLASTALNARGAGMRSNGWAPPPGLQWASYFGDSDSEAGEAIAVAPDGTVVITGFTMAFVPAFDIDAFVARFSADGTTLLNAYRIDGASIDGAFGIGVDRNGIVTVVGQTDSPDFPVTPDAVQREYAGGGGDGFIVQLSPAFELMYATYYGGSGEEAFTDLAMDNAGGFALCGYTSSTDLLVTQGAFQTSYGGGAMDAFAVRFASGDGGTPELAYATYLGGSGDDADFDPADPYGRSLDERLLRQAVAVTPEGAIVVAGMTWSADFPVTAGAWQTDHSEYGDVYEENADIFLAVLNPYAVGSRQLRYSTLIGGAKRDAAEDLVVRSSAIVTLVGLSRSPEFPVTANACQGALNGSQDAVITELLPLPAIPREAQIRYSTFFGGSEKDAANGVHRLASGDIAVGGVTASADFPTTDGTFRRGSTDLFLLRLKTSRAPADQVVLSSLIGGSAGDDLMVGPTGNGFGDLFFTGDTSSEDFPGVTAGYQDAFGGGIWDAVVGRYYVGVPGYGATK